MESQRVIRKKEDDTDSELSEIPPLKLCRLQLTFPAPIIDVCDFVLCRQNLQVDFFFFFGAIICQYLREHRYDGLLPNIGCEIVCLGKVRGKLYAPSPMSSARHRFFFCKYKKKSQVVDCWSSMQFRVTRHSHWIFFLWILFHCFPAFARRSVKVQREPEYCVSRSVIMTSLSALFPHFYPF